MSVLEVNSLAEKRFQLPLSVFLPSLRMDDMAGVNRCTRSGARESEVRRRSIVGARNGGLAHTLQLAGGERICLTWDPSQKVRNRFV